MSKPPTAFGKYLRAARKVARVSQRELGTALGVNHSYVSEVESGARAPFPAVHWAAIVKALPGATMAELMRAAAQSRPLEIDLAKSSAKQADLVLALALRVR